MNPITNAKNLNKLNERELSLGLTGSKTSWHSLYEESAWIFVGGLAYDLTEGDVIAVFSQYGEIVNINFVRDKKTGKPKGYCFICYEDQRSTILAVDNFNGIKVLNRILRVDHVQDYKIPKEFGDEDEVTRLIRTEGCGPNVKLVTEVKKEKSPSSEKTDRKKKLTKIKKEHLSHSEDDESKQDERPRKQLCKNVELRNESNFATVRVKEEPVDSQYDKYNKRDEHRLRDKSRSQKKDDRGEDESEKSDRKEHRPKDKKEELRKEQNEKNEKSSGKRAAAQSSSSSEDYSRGFVERTSMRDGRDRSYGGNGEPDVRRPVEEEHERSRKRQTEVNMYQSEDRNRNKRDRDEEKHSRDEEKSSHYSEWKDQRRESDLKGRHCEKRDGEDSRRNAGRQEETAAKRYNEQYDSHSKKDRSKDRNSDKGKRRSRSSSSDEYDRKKRRN